MEILDSNQQELAKWLKKFRSKFYLVGGTAIAFHIGHRRSIDFDLFTKDKIKVTSLTKAVYGSGFHVSTLYSSTDQVHFIIHDVKLTFFEYPYPVEATMMKEGFFQLPDLLSLAAMKAFALGGRGKWKDYVDLYFIIRHHYKPSEITAKALQLFSGVFNPLLFIKQLSYFGDINYSEPVTFMPGFEVTDDEVKAFLTDAALTGF